MNLNPIIRRATLAIRRREAICFDAAKKIRGANYRDNHAARWFVLAVADEFARRHAKWRRFSEALNDAF
jgi:hypothetical protein